jgi:hypothetical protein
MCLAVYIASKQNIPTIPWDKDKPAFCIIEANQNEHHEVYKQFSLPHVYYIGTQEGCGCKFIYDENNPEFVWNSDDLELRKHNVSKLVSLLNKLLLNEDWIEFFSCYAGNQTKEPVKIKTIEPEALFKSSIFADAWDKPQYAIIKNALKNY